MSTPGTKNPKKFFPIGVRLVEVIDNQPQTLTAVSRKIGMSKQALSALRHTANPGIDTLIRISDAIGQSPNEILKPFLSIEVAESSVANEPESPYGYTSIPILNAMAAAGIPREVNMESAERYPTMRIHASVLRPGAGYVALQVSGLSMQPVLNDGDWVIVSRVHDLGELRAGRMYVLVTEAGAQVKLLESRTHDTLHFRSENPDFGPVQATRKDILQLWEVRMQWRHA